MNAASLFQQSPSFAAPTVLRDPEIRDALRSHLMRRSPAPIRILEELGVHNGNAKADLVAVYKEMHCFEIKGATDSIRRLVRQAPFFDLAFPKVSLVTTPNHLSWCLENVPAYWGILIAETANNAIHIRYERSAKNNPCFVKQKALMMLWKDELESIATDTAKIRIKSSYTREDIATHLSDSLDKSLTLASIQNAILGRSTVDGVANISDVTR